VKAEIRVQSDPPRGRGTRFVINWPFGDTDAEGLEAVKAFENKKKETDP